MAIKQRLFFTIRRIQDGCLDLRLTLARKDRNMIKLSKKTLLPFVRETMLELGYTEFQDCMISNANLFVKNEGNLFLTIGFTIHRFYSDAFTFSYYLSRTTNWAECWGDIPHRLTYVRPGELMSTQEREYLTVDPNCKKNPQITDMWWNAFNVDGAYDLTSLSSFAQAIRLTENRVIQQPDICEKIYASKVLKQVYDEVIGTIQLVKSEEFLEEFEFLPKHEVKGTSIEWFKAAETYLKSNSIKANFHKVKFLAMDSARVYYMRFSS